MVEHDAVLGVGDRAVERDFADPDRLVREQHAFGVEAVEQLLEAFALVADETPLGNREAVVGDFTRRDRVASELGDRADVDVVAVEIGEEQAQPAQPGLRIRVRPRDQQHDLGLERLGGPDLAAGDLPAAVAVGLRACRDAAGVGAGIGLGHAERDVEVTRHRTRQELRLQAVVAELHHRVQPEHREMQRRATVHRRAAARDLAHHDRGLADAHAAAAELLGDREAQPAALGHPA